MLYKRSYLSPLGEMTMVSSGMGLAALTFRGQKYGRVDEAGISEENNASAVFDRTAEWLDIYFSGRDPGFTPPLSVRGTPFQEEVWAILKTIPYGQVTSYGEIARQIAEKRGIKHMSAQAVGGAVGRNPVAVIVPCHRVVGADGSLTGYDGGLDKKEALLKLEKWL
ncbi:MAG: methylated-DNA--[protein]-cysteine S-methyltransferase [Eubacterium sp.]|nr:methylated-DNA--[protein]-cysteine S-methyltransferase [Eubacterium sp.]MCM1215299.1 methylated-DNA--[protein]-cysteine S-methyltransferase [Lachnospiraceae bacterium]MCM1303687.1 methylated-DNA--[protein]-cysteine S-methyltransferase [Butyrivibrio sp.]MCM1344131.1 methylated-DNA--[protein]-cysteine S-methyltransferase [Muribaculaceae bacterium]MCM1240219.1 methylated-DNA--[protein]-cysteine S-methyltransferase [Lachnospiraceae bacterium]